MGFYRNGKHQNLRPALYILLTTNFGGASHFGRRISSSHVRLITKLNNTLFELANTSLQYVFLKFVLFMYAYEGLS